MLYLIAAVTVLLLHLGFILFALFGAALVARWPVLAAFHLPAVAWAVYIELSGRPCPLTGAENHFRALAGQAGYAGGFIEHYLVSLIYPPGLTPALQWTLAAVVLGINLLLYGRLLLRRRRRR